MKRYEHMVNVVSSRFRHGPKTEERAVDDAMLKVISEKYITLPLYLMDHSGLAMQTTSFNDPWDSGQVGWIYGFAAWMETDTVRCSKSSCISILLPDKICNYKWETTALPGE